jgi:hypothetical protein
MVTIIVDVDGIQPPASFTSALFAQAQNHQTHVHPCHNPGPVNISKADDALSCYQNGHLTLCEDITKQGFHLETY